MALTKEEQMKVVKVSAMAKKKLDERSLFDNSEKIALEQFQNGELFEQIRSSFLFILDHLNSSGRVWTANFMEGMPGGVLLLNNHHLHFDLVVNPVRLKFEIPDGHPFLNEGSVPELEHRVFFLGDETLTWYTDDSTQMISTEGLALKVFDWMAQTYRTH